MDNNCDGRIDEGCLENPELTTYTYNGFNQLLTATDGAGVTTFSWDGNGNQTQKAGPEGTTTYTWDVRDRLVELGLPDGSVSTFGYDTNHLRVSVDDGDGVRRVLLDGIEEYAQYDAGGARVERVEHDPSGVDRLLGQTTAEDGKAQFVTDALGSVYGLADSGGLASSYSYDVYGEREVASGSAWAFRGRPVVGGAANLGYVRARYLNFDTGRYIAQDVLGQIVLPNQASIPRNFPHPYGDTGSNPATSGDSSGLVLDETMADVSMVTSMLAKVAGVGMAVYFAVGNRVAGMLAAMAVMALWRFSFQLGRGS